MKGKLDPRHQGRIATLQALFEWSFNSTDIEGIITRDIEDYVQLDSSSQNKSQIDQELALFLAKGVTENLEPIDKIIESCAPEWPIIQIAKVDLEILRIAIFELSIARNVPPKVAIDEAVELAKEFGGENSSKFVNGVLGTVVNEMLPEIEKTGTGKIDTTNKSIRTQKKQGDVHE
ncbi:MAG: transcription antitermination factor NusB [Candidatus Woykebacteria bacterium GWB1_45_5]|uniref:Transcription antitermination protein NusB n=2 Tax=Candidatus Woykeibacteriota TaxID=1817899 RepID=A0A1G1W3N9_9BACT|nr:MAG: transcription antitermination factor NusB [Candidatus Woykebacteria bacterium GWA1_44_8]OGY24471.1 MAG: transcription antitermination factor NusB [Candidatus Woykebacteria bacterium GWB1_45_5]